MIIENISESDFFNVYNATFTFSQRPFIVKSLGASALRYSLVNDTMI